MELWFIVKYVLFCLMIAFFFIPLLDWNRNLVISLCCGNSAHSIGVAALRCGLVWYVRTVSRKGSSLSLALGS